MSISTSGDARPRRAARFGNYRWIPWAIVGCFVVVFAVNGGLVYFAAKSWPGLTVDNAYSDGLAYNRVIEESEREATLGWKIELTFAQAKATANGVIAITAHDAAGAPLSNLTMVGELIRPVEELPNIPIAFASQGGGVYTAGIGQPRPGQWNVFLTARRGDDVWHGGKRILVPGQ